MKRTPLRRKKYMKRGAPPRATGRPSQRFAARRCDPYRAWIRTLPCEMGRRLPWWTGIPCDGPVECAHVKSRGAGGDDVGNCLALCRAHHRLQHSIGWPHVARDFAFDPAAIAKQLEARWVLRDFGGTA